MATVKRLVCLANSRKLRHRCIAGKVVSDTAPGEWIRPVSDCEHGELALFERCYADGTDPQVMDVMDVPLASAAPKGYQTENWTIDATVRPAKVGSASWAQLAALADPVAPLWFDGRKTSRGQNDEITLASARRLTSSLRLLHVPSLTVAVFTHRDEKRAQGRFHHAGADYWLWITDPAYEEPYKAGPPGHYAIGESYLTISISEPFDKMKACYKLIAAIIERRAT